MLGFDFDTGRMEKIGAEFDASEKQLAFAYSRALRRTAQNLKTKARKGIREKLGLRSAAVLRRRLQGFKFKRGSGMGEVRMWFGMNDMPVSSFKGRVSQAARGASLGGRTFPGSFVGKNSKGARTIMQRRGKRRWPVSEVRVPVSDEVEVFVEDEVFDEIEELFFKNFRAEVRARTIYEVGG
jgi:Prophage minor tail protein Z (GPZ)